MPEFLAETFVEEGGNRSVRRVEGASREAVIKALKDEGLIVGRVQTAPDLTRSRYTESGHSSSGPSSKLPLFGLIAGLAGFAMGGAALVLYLFFNPLGNPLKSYSMKSARSAFLALTQIGSLDGDEANLNDLYGMMRIIKQNDTYKESRELARTIRIKHEVKFNDNMLLFVSYRKDGDMEYDVFAMNKDEGKWTLVSSYRFANIERELEKSNEELAKSLRRWKSTGER